MELSLEYRQGYSDWLGCRIDLRYRPLIPRVETAEWVKVAISEISESSKAVQVLDMFAGSGCVGIAVLRSLPNVTVDFADISSKCLRQVDTNCQLNGISEDRYRLVESDVFRCRSREVNSTPKFDLAHYGVSSTSRGAVIVGSGYEFILANPPYCLKKNVDESVLEYEPRQAVLGGGKDGLQVIKKFLAQAPNYLKPGGNIFLEFDDFQKPLLESWLKASKYAKWEFKKDQFGRWRWVRITTS